MIGSRVLPAAKQAASSAVSATGSLLNAGIANVRAWATSMYAPTVSEPIEQKELTPEAAINELMKAGSSYFEPFFKRPFNPAKLYQKAANYTIYDEMREDDQVFAALSVKKHIVFGTGWEIYSEDIEADQETIDGLQWMLTEFMDEGLDARLYEMLTALDYGVSITEKVAAMVADGGKYDGKVGFRALKTRPPHGIFLHTDEHGNLTRIVQGVVDVPPEKVIIFSNRPEFQNPYGKSDLNEGVYRAWWSKDKIVAFYNMYLERRATPTMKGVFPKGYSPQDQAALLQALKTVQACTAFVVPAGTEVDALHTESATTAMGYKDAIEMYNLQIARACLVPDLAGFSGKQTGGGSFALGAEHIDLLFQIVSAIRRRIEQKVNNEIIKPLIDWNWGEYAGSTIRFRFKPPSKQDAEKMISLWTDAVKSNIWKPSDEEIKHAQMLLGFPENEVVERPEPPAPFGAEIGPDGKPIPPKMGPDGKTMPPKGGNPFQKPQPAGAKGAGVATKGPARNAPAKPGAKQSQKPAKEYVDKPARALTVYERRVNFTEIDRVTQEREDALTATLAAIVKEAVNDMAGTIKDKKVVELRKIALASKPPLKPKYETQMKTALRAAFKDMLGFGWDQAQAELGKAKTYSVLDEGVGGLDWGEVTSLLDSTAEFVAHEEWEAIRRVSTPILQESVRNGWGVAETMKQLDLAYQPWAEDFGAARLATTVRTNLMRVFNEGRQQSFDDAGDEVAALQLSAVLDSHTTELCLRLDGKVVSKHDPRFRPPFHFGCRTVAVAVLKGEAYTEDELPALDTEDGFLYLAQDGKPANEED